VADAPALAERMLGGTLVTKQTGAEGKPVNVLLVAQKMRLASEKYFAVALDRKTAGPLIIACAEGGTSIEDLAEKFPDRIVRVSVDPLVGLTDAHAASLVAGLGVQADQVADATAQVRALYTLFTSKDATLLEVNPLATELNGRLIAADAKLNFDDNASFRQKDLFALRDESQEDPREVAAHKADLNYIGLDGNIGCMVNGAGLAMATMDIIKLHGGAPANFLDVGGNATEGQVVEAFRVLTADPKVKVLLVNIFGGIMKCDVIAAGIVAGAKALGLTLPLVVRLEGTNVAAGKALLAASGLNITAAEDLDDAAMKAVAALAR
jgi:succinyl-CoA synthetase beta subunit